MGRQTASFVWKRKTCLHLLLVMGVFLYLYSPFLDHWLGNETYARPHTHAHVFEDIVLQISPQHVTDSLGIHIDHDHQHEEGFLCFLDIDALLTLLLAFFIVPNAQFAQHPPLVFEIVYFYCQVSIIDLASLDPPPNI